MYTLDITDRAKKDIASLKKSGGKAVTNKIEKLLQELISFSKKTPFFSKWLQEIFENKAWPF